MTKYTILFILCFVFCGTLKSQEYLLDSLSTYSIFYTSQGPNESRGESKFKYDSEKRLVLRTNRSSYEIYTYSDLENTKEFFFTSPNEIGFREIDYLNEDGFITESVKYESVGGDLKITKKTNYYKATNGKTEKEVSEIYRNGSIVYDYVFYRDTIDYLYDGDELTGIQKVRYNSMGIVKECTNTKYTYFDDYLFEKVEIAEDDVCDSYITLTETYSYYSDSDYYDYDSVLIYGYQDEGWGLYNERRTTDYMQGDAMIVSYAGSSYTAPFPDFNGIYIYKKAAVLLNNDPEESKLDIQLKPNISPVRGLINLQSDEISNLQIGIYNVQGALIKRKTVVNNNEVQIVAPSLAGTYFVKIMNVVSGDFVVKKIIVF